MRFCEYCGHQPIRFFFGGHAPIFWCGFCGSLAISVPGNVGHYVWHRPNIYAMVGVERPANENVKLREPQETAEC